jgi:ABC-2 type transport system permease protein
MGLAAVTRKDFHDSVRSLSLQATTTAFVLFATWLAAIQWIPLMYQDSAVDASTLALLNSMRQPTVFIVPFIGLMLAYDTIVGERESGSIRLLMGLPNSRAAVVFGKFVGRSGVLAVSILVGYGVAGLVALATYESFDVSVFGRYTLLTVFYGTVYVGLATGFSAATGSRQRALVGAGGLYTLFLLGWESSCWPSSYSCTATTSRRPGCRTGSTSSGSSIPRPRSCTPRGPLSLSTVR